MKSEQEQMAGRLIAVAGALAVAGGIWAAIYLYRQSEEDEDGPEPMEPAIREADRYKAMRRLEKEFDQGKYARH